MRQEKGNTDTTATLSHWYASGIAASDAKDINAPTRDIIPNKTPPVAAHNIPDTGDDGTITTCLPKGFQTNIPALKNLAAHGAPTTVTAAANPSANHITHKTTPPNIFQ